MIQDQHRGTLGSVEKLRRAPEPSLVDERALLNFRRPGFVAAAVLLQSRARPEKRQREWSAHRMSNLPESGPASGR